MEPHDIINSLFQFGGAAFTCVNIRKLYSTKCAKGVSWIAIGFFVVWGMWNTVFYLHLSQPVSLIAGLLMLLANLVYAVLIYYYESCDKRERQDWLNKIKTTDDGAY